MGKRGRVLIRACTKETPDPEPVSVQRRLSTHGVEPVAPQLGRLLSSRSRSAHSTRRTDNGQVQLERQASDRGSSVPPTRSDRSQVAEVQKESETAIVSKKEDETEGPSPVALVVLAP